MVRILEVGITGLTVLWGGGLGPVEEEKGLTAGELGLEDRVRQGPSNLSPKEQIPPSPLSNEEPEKSWEKRWKQGLTRLLGKKGIIMATANIYRVLTMWHFSNTLHILTHLILTTL